ncbi:spore coat protein U domain-containing protein [Aquisediminimonas profunda]|uniref:spore coat protein U domain-containing protein n=1 Tax=Aquisediminimonas profunda TaxID=1550733 RepID=UPI001C62CBD2|nr:spore coat protein U domain-containing protein [Aquisediminimonas profunda]
MPVNLSQTRHFTRLLISVLLAVTLLVGGIVLPAPARAAPTDNWQCTPELEALLPVALSANTPAGQRTDKRTISLNCTFDVTNRGNALVTLCLSAPLGNNPDGVTRQARSVVGNTRVHYALTAEPGNVPNVQPQVLDALTPALKPLYSVMIQTNGPGQQTFRHQFKLVTEFEALTRRGLDAGDYGDLLSGFVVSIHQGGNCGPVLWGPPNNAIGELANLPIAARLAPQCDFLINRKLDFGTTSVSVAGQNADGLITLSCLTNLPNVTISMGTGNNPATSGGPVTRQMRRSDGAATIPYLILKPDGTEWSQSGSIIPGTPLDVPGIEGMSVPISGLIPQGTPLPPTGNYSDAVIIMLSF